MLTAIAQRRGQHKVANMADEEDPVLTLLESIIDANGSTPKSEKDKALFTVLKAIYRTVKPLEKRIDTLEQKNLIMWAEKHPKGTTLIAFLVTFVAMTIHELYPIILSWADIFNPLKQILK